MKMFVDNTTLVEDIKRVFSNAYPFLKIELYIKKAVERNVPAKKEPLPYSLHMGVYLNEKNIHYAIDIGHDITVAELERQFKKIGLIAEVQRKSGKVWIGTLLTNNWTLQQQNAEGEEISRHFENNGEIN
jgi:hypothetical protein